MTFIEGLSMSGAADNITYLAGVGEALVDVGLRWTKSAGTSSGAAMVSKYAEDVPERLPEQAKAASAIAMDRVNGIGKVSRMYPEQHLAVLTRTGLRSTDRLYDLLKASVSVEGILASGWDTGVVSTNLRTGASKFHRPHTSPDYHRAIQMSMSFPGLFQGVRFHKRWPLHTDGILEVQPVRRVIEMGATRIWTVNAADPSNVPPWDDRKATTIGVVKRSVDLMSWKLWEAHMKLAELHNRLLELGAGDPGKVPVRIVDIRPSEPLGKSTNFDRDEAERAFEIGYRDGLRAAEWEGLR